MLSSLKRRTSAISGPRTESLGQTRPQAPSEEAEQTSDRVSLDRVSPSGGSLGLIHKNHPAVLMSRLVTGTDSDALRKASIGSAASNLSTKLQPAIKLADNTMSNLSKRVAGLGQVVPAIVAASLSPIYAIGRLGEESPPGDGISENSHFSPKWNLTK